MSRHLSPPPDALRANAAAMRTVTEILRGAAMRSPSVPESPKPYPGQPPIAPTVCERAERTFDGGRGDF